MKKMKHSFYKLAICLGTFLTSGSFSGFAQSLPAQSYIRIDQFGYLPAAKKVAVIAKPYAGFNSAEAGVVPYSAGSVNVQLLRASDNAVVFEALPVQWLNGSSTDDSRSGDRGYWFDFSSYQTAGEYYIRVKTGSGATNYVDSYRFKIGEDVYRDVLRRAMNMFYYQRSNFDKNTPSTNTTGYAAGKNWEDGAWYNRNNQSTSVEFKNGGSARNIRGGWIDAGDPNRYIGFAGEAVHDLLSCYNQFKSLWDGLNLNIPESNNSIPDILDEVKFEIDWVKTMQNWNYSSKTGSGGVLNKVGIYRDPGYTSPPSTDQRALKYEGECWHSSVIAAGMFAHAAVRYNQHGNTTLTGEVAELTERAEKAWDHYVNTTDKTRDCDNGDIEAGDGDGPTNPSNGKGQYIDEHIAEAVTSAVYLYKLTGKSVYNDFIKNNYQRMRPWVSGGGEWGIYRSQQSDAMLYYATLSNADGTVKDAIIQKKKDKANATDSKNPYKVVKADGLYRANSYYDNWGTNVLLSRLGSNNMDYVTLGYETDQTNDFKERAQSILNYIHGTNPIGMCYLTNMNGYGADFSVKQMHHTWFLTGTRYDNQESSDVGPAPGYLVSGYNGVNSPKCMKVLIGKQSYNVLVKDQPVLKRFSEKINSEGVSGYKCDVDQNENYNQPWLYTEPGIYFQSAYIRLLAHFVNAASTNVPVTSVSVTPATASKAAGLNQTVSATVSPSNATNTAVTWTSDNTTVATVNASGLVTTKATGTANIIATTTSGSKKDTCVLTVTAAPASTTCGLITNSGFEANFVNWDITNNNGYASISTDKKSGSQACVITGTGGVNRSSAVGVTAGYELKMNAWAKIEGTPSAAQVGIDYLNDAGTKLGQDFVDITATTYTQIQTKKYPPIGTTKALIWTYKSGGGKLFIDDVCLTQADACGLVENPGFETDFRNWNNSAGHASIVTTGQNYGNRAASLNGNGGLNRSANIAVTSGHRVTFSAQARIEGSPTNAQIGLDFINSSGTKISNQVFTISSTSWAGISYNQVPPSGTTQILIWTYKGSTGGKLFIDDVCLSTSASTARTAAATAIIAPAVVDNDMAKGKIYPNPVTNEMKVPVKEGMATIQITDVTGKIVMVREVTIGIGQKIASVSTQALRAGTYIVTIKQGATQTIHRIIKSEL
jgi:endoglucanase